MRQEKPALGGAKELRHLALERNAVHDSDSKILTHVELNVLAP